MKTVDRPSPNFDSRPAHAAIDILLLHYTGMPTAREAIERLCDPGAKVSAHYTVDEDGTVYAHVDEADRAWHAGVSSWGGDADVNTRSIGIEIVNPGHEFGYRPFTSEQMTALTELCRDILDRHPIPAHRVLGHSDVAPARKQDPGELFDWAGLAAAGVGLVPHGAPELDAPLTDLQADLGAFGYDCPDHGRLDDATVTVVTAFQRHFRQKQVNGRPDAECTGLARALADHVRNLEATE